MRDLAGCFAHQAARVAEATCSGNSKAASMAERPVQNAITCFYRTTLSSSRKLLTRVIWSRHRTGASLSVMIEVDGDDWSKASRPSAGQTLHLRKKKGSRSFVEDGAAISLHWDVSAAAYGAGTEPEKGFYLVVITEAELGLLLGDRCGEFVKRLESALPVAEFAEVSRREQVRGATRYSTKARLGGGRKEHQITISCKGDDVNAEGSELCVSVDDKNVVDVQKLKWNFRGNQAIFVDGSIVDVMWDVHDWWFCDASHCALFMFRSRSTPESRLWAEEEELAQRTPDVPLLIQAFKNQ